VTYSVFLNPLFVGLFRSSLKLLRVFFFICCLRNIIDYPFYSFSSCIPDTLQLSRFQISSSLRSFFSFPRLFRVVHLDCTLLRHNLNIPCDVTSFHELNDIPHFAVDYLNKVNPRSTSPDRTESCVPKRRCINRPASVLAAGLRPERAGDR
jgi:hypothetical protein